MHGGHVTKGHPNIWAFLSIIAFPIVLLSMDVLGVSGLWPFIMAMGATLLILVLEAIVRGRIWPFEPGFAEHLGHPDLPMRLAIFMAATLFLLQTAFFIAVSVDPRFDESIMAFVLRRQCVSSYASTHPACRRTSLPPQLEPSPSQTADTIGFAIRTQAKKLWYPNAELATCAQRIIEITPIENNGQDVFSIVQCTNWGLMNGSVLKKQQSQIHFVGARITKDETGFVRVVAWTDDYTSPNWTSVLGSIAESTRQTAQTLPIYPQFSTVLEAESLGRAQAELTK